MPWSQGYILKGAGVLTGHGAPSSSNPATANAFKGQSYLDEDTGKLYANFDGVAWTNTPITLRGRSFFPVQGPPDQTVGNENDSVFDVTDGMRIYGPKKFDGSFPKTNLFLQGTAGSDANLPIDIVGNSLVLAPKSGTQNPARIELINSGNSPVFVVDDSGNAMIAGAVNITGVTTANTLNAGSLTAANLTAAGTATFQQDVQVAGASVVAQLEAQALDVKGPATFEQDTRTFGTANSGAVNTGTLTAGTSNVKTLTAEKKLIADELDVQHVIVGSGKASGDVQVYGGTTLYGDLSGINATLTGDASVRKLLANDDSAVHANLTVDKALKTNSIAVAAQNAGGNAIAVHNAAGDGTVFAVDASGNVSLAGTLTVAGAETNASLNAGALTATSFVDEGNAHIKGALSAEGDTSLQKVTAANADVQALSVNAGLTVVGAAQLSDISAKAAHVVSLLADDKLQVLGPTSLQSLSATDTQLGKTTSDALTIAKTLTVQGASSLQSVTAADLYAHSLNVETDVNLSGNVFSSGPVFTNTLQVTSSDSTPFAINNSSQQLLSLDSAGDLIIAGALTVQGTGASGATNAGALTVSSFKDTGAAQISGPLTVSGDTSLAKTTAGALTAASLTAQSDSSVAGALSVSSNLTVGGSAVIGSIGTGGINSTGISIARDKNGSLANLSVQDRIYGDRLQVSQVNTGTLTASDVVTLQSTLTQNGAALFKNAVSVQGQTTLGVARTGALTADSLTANGALSVAGNTSLGGNLASGAITSPAVTVQLPSSGAASYPLQVLDPSGKQLLTCNTAGDFAIAGTLSVAGAQTNTATNAGALQATSFVDSGNATIQGNLSVQGSTTLASAQASGLSVSGNTTLGAVSTGDISASKVTTTGAIVSGGALTAYGNATLANTTAQAVSATSVNTSGAAQIGTTLNVQGASTVANLTAAAITASSASITGNASVGGTINATGAATLGSSLGVSGAVTMASTLNVSGQAQAAALAVKLPSSNPSGTPLTVATASNTSLLSLDGSGNLTIPGTLTSSNVTSGGSAVSATDISATGKLTVQGTSTLAAVNATNVSASGTLGVQGNTTLASLSASSSAISGNETVGGTLKVTGASTLAAVSAASLTTTGNASIGGTLGVTGASTLAGLSATNVSASGTLGVSGTSTLAAVNATNIAASGTLSVNGTSTMAGVNAGALTCTSFSSSGNQTTSGTLTAAAVTVSLPSSGAAATPILLKNSSGTALASVDSSGNLSCVNVTNTGTLTTSGVAALKGGLAVTGATTAGNVTSGGTVAANNFTLTSGQSGSITFADGTTQNTASVGNGAPATVWLQGDGPPNASTAPSVQQGNFYWDRQNSLAYGPATAAGWQNLTQVTNLQGPSGPPGGTTSYRHAVRGSTWIAGTPTANTAYPVCALISSASTTSGSQGYNIALAEPMYANGSLTALTAFSNGGGNGNWTINVLKNGTVVYTATSFITSGQTAATAKVTLPTDKPITFVAGDVITMTASTSLTTANQYVFTNLFYTTNA